MTKIGDVIEKGPIPDDVVEVEDRSGDRWYSQPDGHWHMFFAFWDCLDDGRLYLENMWLPATVIKVREPEPNSLVFSLPEIPDNVVALVGAASGVCYVRDVDEPGYWETQMEAGVTISRSLGALLDNEGMVRGELAPERTLADEIELLRKHVDELGVAGVCHAALDRIEAALRDR